MRRVRTSGKGSVRRVSRFVHPPSRTALRALRLSRAMARSSLCRVRGPAARLRVRTLCDRLRRTGSSVRSRMERAWPAPARRRCCRGRGRGDRATRCGRACVRARRSGKGFETWRRPAAQPRGRARTRVGDPGRRPPVPQPLESAATRAVARRASKERPRDHRRDNALACNGLPGRRRLHLGCDRGCLCVGTPHGGCQTGRRPDPREGGSLD